MSDESTFDIPDVAASNARHDREHGDPRDYQPIRTAWKDSLLMRRGMLTDKKINQYEKLGYYTAEFRLARKELQERKKAKRMKREGNFDVTEDGRMIYNPR